MCIQQLKLKIMNNKLQLSYLRLKRMVPFLIIAFFLFMNHTSFSQITCGPINTFYQTLGKDVGLPTSRTEVWRYNNFLQSYVYIAQLGGAETISNYAANSSYNAKTQLIYAGLEVTSPENWTAGNPPSEFNVYDPTTFAFVGKITITGNTKNISNSLFAYDDYIGYVRDGKIIRFKVTGIGSYPATIAVEP